MQRHPDAGAVSASQGRMPIRIVLIDDHRLFREGVAALLTAHPGFDVVAEAGDAQQAFDAVAASLPDVAILDLSLHGASGLEVGRRILQRHPQAKLIALSNLRDQRHVTEALQAGFLGYVCKDESGTSLVAAIQAVAQRQSYLSPTISATLVPDGDVGRSPLGRLTRREREVFDLTITGAMTSQIATELKISKRTVETHRARILHKLGAHSAVDLVRLAARLGVLSADLKQ